MDLIETYPADIPEIIDNNGPISGISDTNDLTPDLEIYGPEALDQMETSEINERLDQLAQNTKIDTILPNGQILEDEDITFAEEKKRMHLAPDSYPVDIVNTPVITPNYSGLPQVFLVQRRVVGTRHGEAPEILYSATIGRTISHTEIALKLASSQHIPTRYGNVMIAPTRKTYTKDEKLRLWEAKKLQRELEFDKYPEIDESDEEYDEFIEKRKLGKNILEASQRAGTKISKQSRITKDKYKELVVTNSVNAPIEIEETDEVDEIVVPKYEILTLENGLLRRFDESDREFEFRKYWTQIAVAIGDDISIGTAIALGKMKSQKIIWNVKYDPQMEELIQIVDTVYLQNPLK